MQQMEILFLYTAEYIIRVFWLNKQIKLIGENRDNTIIAATGYAINITANNVEILQFTITALSYPHAGILAHEVEKSEHL
ncbi:MAG: hypothetical protein DRP38_08150 [Thermotogae bacterium]|nr:MAG: hypothetical protein DRP38_08150 [Thermotogota bacterium]